MSSIIPNNHPKSPSPASRVPLPKRSGLFWSAKTRILVGYTITLLFLLLGSVPVFHYLLVANVNARVQGDLIEEMETFCLLVGAISLEPERQSNSDSQEQLENLRQLDQPQTPHAHPRLQPHQHSHADTHLAPPQSRQELQDFFTAYLANRLPEDEVYLLAFLGDQFYQSSPRALPEPVRQNFIVSHKWKADERTRGVEQTILDDDLFGDILYLVEPIVIDGERVGTFLVVHTTKGEIAEALDAVVVLWKVMIVLLLAALIVGWVYSGKVLAPLQQLSNVAHRVDGFDFTHRIPIQGTGELADLSATFNDMLDRLQSAFISQRNFISDAGHELRTPITIIRGHLELLDDDDDFEEQVNTRILVVDELDRMARLVDDLSLLVKSERPDFLAVELVNGHTLIKDLFAKVQTLAVRQWRLETVARVHIVCDRQRITQAVMNLAHNAAQHTQPSGNITIGSKASNGQLQIWVRDDGDGVMLQDQHRIFDRFARASKMKRRSGGSGLGLSIAKAIVEAHHGKIVLESQPGAGATFTIVIPLDFVINNPIP